MAKNVIRVGTVVESDFGRGPVSAITRDWVIHRVEGDGEVAIHRHDNWICVPVEGYEEGGGMEETEI